MIASACRKGIRQCRCEAGDQAELGRLERRLNPCMNECGGKAEAGGHSGRAEEDAGARGLRQVREIPREASSALAMIEGTALVLSETRELADLKGNLSLPGRPVMIIRPEPIWQILKSPPWE